MSAASFDTLGTARDLGSADFPGCESFHLPASEIDRYEGRLEFWDGDTETAWKVCDPTSIYHEQPSWRLARMAERVSGLRGSPIECFGSADLVRQGATGRKRWLMQADEVLYLHPDRSRLKGPAIDVDEDPLPDVVLEVDHTTDVRRRKLDIYKESGFPEVWVLVPWESSVRAPGLAIHVRRREAYREEAASRAFPGWKAEEIHCALTEDPTRSLRFTIQHPRCFDPTSDRVGRKSVIGFTPESVIGFTGMRRSNRDGRNRFLRPDSEALQRI